MFTLEWLFYINKNLFAFIKKKGLYTLEVECFMTNCKNTENCNIFI